MNIVDFKVAGPKLIELKSFADDRGFFVERYKRHAFEEIGLKENFVQDNFSRSAPGVLRGLHYQYDLPQGKLVTALRGRIFDVAVDIRAYSPTFGQYVSVELDGTKPSWFWIPAGFAHGFCVIGNESADVMYKVDNYYNSKGENGFVWNDSDISIEWPIQKPLLSSKDELLMTFSEYRKNPKF